MAKVSTFYQHAREFGLTHAVLLGCRWGLLSSPLSGIIEPYLPVIYEEKFRLFDELGYWPKIKNPRSFNEKLLFILFFTDNDEYSMTADKWEVREYVSDAVGDHILNEVYLLTEDPEAISFENLPQEFVIKPTHGSGWVHRVENKRTMDREWVRSQCLEWLSTTYGEDSYEYWYEDIEPRIMVERYLRNEHGMVPRDFKFYVFHGTVEYIDVHFDRFDHHRSRFFTREWEPLSVLKGHPLGPAIEPPNCLQEMIDIAETLGNPFGFMRVDLYQPSPSQIVFGELTVAPNAGRTGFRPSEFDFELGHLWDLDKGEQLEDQ